LFNPGKGSLFVKLQAGSFFKKAKGGITPYAAPLLQLILKKRRRMKIFLIFYYNLRSR